MDAVRLFELLIFESSWVCSCRSPPSCRSAVLLVSQSNPYPTPVLRGIMGSVSTLLFTTLGAVALLSSVALRLLPPEPEEADASQNRLGPGLRLEQTNPC